MKQPPWRNCVNLFRQQRQYISFSSVWATHCSRTLRRDVAVTDGFCDLSWFWDKRSFTYNFITFCCDYEIGIGTREATNLQ